MILIHRQETRVSFDEIDGATVEQDPLSSNYKVSFTIPHSESQLYAVPGQDESVDIVDCGKRICCIMQKRVAWYGAAPK